MVMAKQTCDCEGIKDKRSARCRGCYLEEVKGKKVDRYTSRGYVYIHLPSHPRADKSGYILEHTIMMERELGRFLLPNENVHHKNGVRDDNRPKNLELWITMQPTGIRAEDAVRWAKEILKTYGAV